MKKIRVQNFGKPYFFSENKNTMNRQLKFKSLIEYKNKPSEWVTYGINDKPDFVDMFVRGVINKPLVEDLQFTGLLDSKGVDIYEGDILSGKMNKGDGIRTGIASIDANGVMLTIKNRAPRRISTYGSRMEVIGNIHENPELLK